VDVSKLVAFAVLTPPTGNPVVTKVTGFAVLGPPSDAVVATKISKFAVLVPSEEYKVSKLTAFAVLYDSPDDPGPLPSPPPPPPPPPPPLPPSVPQVGPGAPPGDHIDESLKLEADGYVDLWEIRLKKVGIIYRFTQAVSDGAEIVWQGETYEALACQMQGERRSTDDQAARPKLIVVNPENVFGAYAAEGFFDLAEVTRFRVLGRHVLANVNIFQKRLWLVRRPLEVTDQVLTLELGSPLDMPAWQTPRRIFSPSEGYPFVVL
jgi:hypothetical protein